MSTPSLSQLKCTACRGGEPTLTAAEIAHYSPEVPDWRVVDHAGIPHLERTFLFDDFVHALHFTDRVGELAEEEEHHPRLTTEWGKVMVEWWTHKIRGLHRNDFIMAAKTDQAYKAAEGKKE